MKFKTGVDLPYVSKTTTYTASAQDYTIDCIGSTSYSITLPTASSIAGRVYNIKNSQTSGAITIDPNGSETIDGIATVTLGAQYQSVTVQSNGTNWIII